MKKLLALALLAFPLLGQPATTIDTGNTGTGPTVHQNNPTINGVVTTVSVANAPVVGTTLNKVAKLTGAPSVAVIVGLTDTAGVLGIVVSGAGTTGNAQIARTGIAPCVFDGATTAGHYVGVSTSVAGDCTDLGATWPTTFVQILGRVWETNGGAGTYNVHIFGPEINGATPITPLIPGTNLVEQRNGTNGQKFEWYKTYTSATNFERVFIDAAGDPLAYHIGSEYGSAGGSPRQLIFGGGAVTTDVAPELRQVQGKSAIGDSTATNKTGGNLILAGGLGTYYYTFVTPNSTGGKTFTITANGTAVVLTEGVSFNCNTLTTTQCAANLATAINNDATLGPLMTAAGALAVCNFTKKTTLYSLTLATNAGAPATATNGTNGSITMSGPQVVGPAGSATAPGFGVSTSAGVYSESGVAVGFASGTVGRLGIDGTSGHAKIRSDMCYGWTNGAISGSTDTTLCRNATGYMTSGQRTLTAATMTVNATGLYASTSHKYSWTNAMVTALGAVLAGDVKVATLPAKTRVKNVYVIINTAATVVDTLTVAIGRTGATYVDYIGASSAMAAANTIYGAVSGDRGTNLTGYDLPSVTGTTDIYAHFIATSGSGKTLADVLTSTGSVYIETEQLP